MAKKAAAKKRQPSNKKIKVETKAKGFTKIPLTELDKFDKLKEDLDLDDKELFIYLINSASANSGENDVYKEKFTVLSEQYSESQQAYEFISEKYKESTAKLLESEELINQLNQRIAELSEATLPIGEKEKMYDELINVITQLGFTSPNELITKYAELSQQYLTLNEAWNNGTQTTSELSNELDKLKSEIQTLTEVNKELKESNIELTGNQFIADIENSTFELVTKYAPHLYQRKLISGSAEEYPNQLINWSILTALRVTFGKL